MSPNTLRYEQFRNVLDEWKIDGVISITVHACTPFDIESKALEDICNESDMPFLHVRTDYSPGDEGQVRTRIEAFIEMLQTKKIRPPYWPLNLSLSRISRAPFSTREWGTRLRTSSLLHIL